MLRRTFLPSLPLGAAAWIGCQRSDRTVIGICPKGTNSIFWLSVEAGSRAAAKDFDVDIIWNGPAHETEFARQIQIFESMMNTGLDGLVLSPSDKTALVGVVDRAMARGIPVTIFDSGLDGDNYLSFVATNNFAAGELSAQTLADLLEGAGRIVLVKHVPGSSSTGQRERGFEAAAAETHTGLEILDEQYCMADRARALRIVEDMLTAHPELDGMFASSEAATVGATQALRARNRTGDVKLVGFDASPTLQEGLRDGSINALLVQDPFQIGYVGVETIVKKLRGETPEKVIYSPATVVTQANMNEPEIHKLLNPPIEEYLE